MSVLWSAISWVQSHFLNPWKSNAATSKSVCSDGQVLLCLGTHWPLLPVLQGVKIKATTMQARVLWPSPVWIPALLAWAASKSHTRKGSNFFTLYFLRGKKNGAVKTHESSAVTMRHENHCHIRFPQVGRYLFLMGLSLPPSFLSFLFPPSAGIFLSWWQWWGT